MELGNVESTCMPTGPASGVLSLCVKEVVGFCHGWGTGEEGGVVYETGLLVVLAGFRESEEVGGVE